GRHHLGHGAPVREPQRRTATIPRQSEAKDRRRSGGRPRRRPGAGSERGEGRHRGTAEGRAGASQVALLVAAVFWTWLWGPLGLMLATPLTVCLVVLGKHVPEVGFITVLLAL